MRKKTYAVYQKRDIVSFKRFRKPPQHASFRVRSEFQIFSS